MFEHGLDPDAVERPVFKGKLSASITKAVYGEA